MGLSDAFLMGMLEDVGAPVLKAFMTTLRWRRVDEQKDRRVHREHGPVIWAFWHGQLIFPAYIGRDRGIRILISTHRDGEIVARIAKGLGHDPTRGSSTRGGVRALKDLARSITNQDLAITPDGPLGPREEAQLGAVLLAQLTGQPIMPLGCAANPGKKLPSWDGFVVPLPFARAAFVWGDPIFVPRGLNATQREDYRLRLEAELKALTRRAEHACRR